MPGYPGSPDGAFSRHAAEGGGGGGDEGGQDQHLHRGQDTQQHQSRESVHQR